MENKIPKLRTMRDKDPMSGAVWVVDENDHMVAIFSIKRKLGHFAGDTSFSTDVSLNLSMAVEFIERLTRMWTPIA